MRGPVAVLMAATSADALLISPSLVKPMTYRQLGCSDMSVSSCCLGTMTCVHAAL